MAGGGKGGNVYDQSANAMQGSMAAVNAAGNRFNNIGNISAGIGGYMNPYENEVINNFQNDLHRQTQMQQGVNAARAATSGAFGGSRHGITEAATNEAAQRALGDYSSQLRHQGFTTAAGLANQDIQNSMGAATGLLGAAGAGAGLAQQGFGMGQAIQQQQMLEGGIMQGLNQMLLDDARGMFEQYVGQPERLLALRSAAATGSPLNRAVTQTESYRPGLFDYLSLGLQGLGTAFPRGIT